MGLGHGLCNDPADSTSSPPAGPARAGEEEMPPPRLGPSSSSSSSRRRRIAAEPPPGLFPGRDDLLRLLAVLAIAAAAATVCSLLNRRPRPFCDSGDYDHYDSCEPCPPNGRCQDGELECVQGFKRYGKACIEDGLLSHTANKILRVCNQHARVLCGQPAEILFQEHDISSIVDELLSKNSAGLNEDGIKLVRIRVLESVQAFFETTLTFNKVKAFKCPELVAELHMPLTCQVRQWIFKNIIFVTTFCILHCSGHCGAFTRDEHYQTELSKYMSSVCEILEDNAINAKIGNSECDPWVVASWLRDHLLVPRERKNIFLWKKVEELILEDSRIDQYPKVIKGESKVVYEWQASGSLSAKIKKVRGARGKSRTGAAAIKFSEELGASEGEVREHGSCDLTRKARTKA
ncbi:hypothetical protein ACP70R_016942 [Stipagrostis hirtigluma subsp. patula]